MSGLEEVQLSKIFVGKLNVRKKVGNVSELVKSIQERGILEPLLVRPSGDRYEVVAGTRRFEAARALGLESIPVIIRELSDDEAIVISLIENLQRNEIQPEEEYDALMFLMHLKPNLYGTEEQLAKAISKSREHIGSVIRAVAVVRGLRKEGRTRFEVKQAPAPEERKEGRALPIVHASMLSTAEKAPTVQALPKEERKEKLVKLAQTIAPLPQGEAKQTIQHFIMNPRRAIQKIKEEALYSHPIKLEISLEPKVANRLANAAEERRMTMERLVPIIIEEWLNKVEYMKLDRRHHIH